VAKDLYIVFNGMFLFNWKKNNMLEVYVPDNGAHHEQSVAQSEDLKTRVALPASSKLSVDVLSTFKPGAARFDKCYDLVIDGSEYAISSSAAYAKITLPIPDATYSFSPSWVRNDTYVQNTYPKATLSYVDPEKVEDKQGYLRNAIVVSEVFVLKYASVEPASLVGAGTSIPAIDIDAGQALVILSLVREQHAGHEHNDAFNNLLVSSNSNHPQYRPSATYNQLEMKKYYPKTPKASVRLPSDWLVPKTIDARLVILSASGMGSCDSGHRCEEC